MMGRSEMMFKMMEARVLKRGEGKTSGRLSCVTVLYFLIYLSPLCLFYKLCVTTN